MGIPSRALGSSSGAMPQIFASPLMRRYYSPLFSSAYLFRFVTAIASVLVPLVISYTIQPFWLTENTFSEQPSVQFKHQMIIMLEGNTPGTDIAWSTYDQLNTMLGAKYRVAEIQARSEDGNRDGKMDDLYVTARFPLKAGEQVNHARFIMFFDTQLRDKVPLQMESAAFFAYSSAVAGSSFHLWGELALRQRSLLPQSNTARTTYNTSIIPKSNGGIDSMDQVLFTTILENYLKRNETTYLANPAPVWMAGKGDEFILEARLHIPQAQIRYQPGVLETLRYGFLQFLAVYIVIAAIAGAVTHFIFENQVFETRVHDDSRPKAHIH